MTDLKAPDSGGRLPSLGFRNRWSGMGLRRAAVLLEVLGATAWCIAGFHLFVDPIRRLEVALSVRILTFFGVDGISGVLGDSFIVFGVDDRPFIAVMTASCTSLASLLALSALAFVVLRERPQVLFGLGIALVWVILANQVRLLSSLLAGRYLTISTLVWFHDWVGAVLNFLYTLVGLLIMIALTMHLPERAEQDRAGRHTARRPNSWARPGFGYRVEMESRPPAPRIRVASLVHRYLLPRRVSQWLGARRERGRVDYRVGHLPPEERAEALTAMAGRGLGVHTATLVAAATHETDEMVLDALANAVAARQWEPISNRQIAALRLWARAWLMRGPATHSATVRAAAPAPGPSAPAPPRAPADAPADAPGVSAAGTDVAGAAAGTSAAGTPAPTDPGTSTTSGISADPGTPTDPGIPTDPGTSAAPSGQPAAPGGRLVAVTGAGGPAGVAVIRALRSAGERVLALDADPDAVGLRLADAAAVLPRADADGYGEALVEVVTAHRPAALICTVAEEYGALGTVQAHLAELGCRSWLPPTEAVDACLDKAAFAAALDKHGVPHPPTATTPEAALDIPGPWIVKPTRGRGSRDVVVVEDAADLERAFAVVPEAIAQTRLAGREFTADALVGRDGTLLTCVPRWRDETRGGISVRGTTFDSAAVTGAVAAALAAVGHTGPANVQGFVTDPEPLTADPDADVEVTIVEINPRFSGGLPLTLAAGADTVNTYLAGILDPEADLPALTFRPGVRMARYFAEVYSTVDGDPLPDPLAATEATR